MTILIPKIPSNVTLVAVTKTTPANIILNLPKEVKHIAENKIQEATKKFTELENLSERKFKKHLIGHLQSNKVAKAVQLFDYIQSVDSIEIANKINSCAANQNKVQKILLQVNISNDSKKFGFDQNQISSSLKQLIPLKNIQICGLMTIIANYSNPKDQKNDFLKMQNLFTELNNTIMQTNPMEFLSMGMSQDYQTAIENGSNMIRLGSLIFQSTK